MPNFHIKVRMGENKRACVLFTGGKDSTYTIHLLRREGYDIVCLLTMLSRNEYSYMLHTASIELANYAAKALEIPLVTSFTAGEKEEELKDIASAIEDARKEYGFHTIASGGICSYYQKDRFSRLASSLGIECKAPLWGVEQLPYMHSLLEHDYSFILTSVSAAGLGPDWLGHVVTLADLAVLGSLSARYKFNPAFEGGEAETFVLNCPLYVRERLEIVKSSKDWHADAGRLLIHEIRSVPK